MFRILMSPHVRRLLPWTFVVCGLLVVGSLWVNGERQEKGRIREDVRLTADQVRLRLQAWTDNRAAAVRLFAGQHTLRDANDVPYVAVAGRVVGLYPGFQALNLVDADGIIREVVPRAGNEAALGRDLSKHPDPGIREALVRAATTNDLCAGPLIELFQGGRGLTTYHPLRDADGELRGYINGVFRVDRLVDACLAEEPLRTNYRFRLRGLSGELVYAHPVKDGGSEWDLNTFTMVAVLGTHWQLEMAPSPEYLALSATHSDEVLALVGMLLVVLITGLMISHFRGLDQLADSQRRYRILVEHVNDMIVRVDPEGRFLYGSPSYCRTFGKTEEQLLGEGFMPLVHEEDRAETKRQMAKLTEPPHTCYIEQRALTARGWRWLAWSDTAEIGPDGDMVAVIGVGRDITARRELEEQLRRFQKLQAVGQLAGGIAHDFNNILQAMMGNLSFVRDELPDGHPGLKDLALVEKSAERAGELTRQLLAFGRRQMLRPVHVEINELLGEHIQLLRRLIGEGIDLEFQPGLLTGDVLADPGQLEQVLMNLCVNARDAVGLTGRIQVGTTEVEISTPPADSDLAPGPYVLIAVEDDGEGMDEEVRDRIFEPFFTTKATGQGTGLGLATVYGIVHQHHGHIAVESQPGRGTTFTVYLPLVDEAAVPPLEAADKETPGGTETILLAEDDDDVRNLTTRALGAFGYKVVAARDGQEAVELVEANPDAFDLVLLDVIMPRLDGPSAARRIRELAPDVELVFASGYAPGEIQEAESGFETASVIAKPYEVGELLRVLRRHLDS